MRIKSNNLRGNLFSKFCVKRSTLLRKVVLLSVFFILFIYSVAGLNAQQCVPNSTYDELSWTWAYYAPCSTTYNCLSYALGITNSWTWPWSGNPTSSTVTTYLAERGYYTSGNTASIISYGPSTSSIAHFSKVLDSSTVRAKCGSLNVLTHYSWNPYYSYSSYGSQRVVYYKNLAMSVYISGPTRGTNSGTYTWCANVSNGTPPYTYYWECSYGGNPYGPWGGGFTTQCVTAQLPLDFDLYTRVTVTDANNAQASDTHFTMNMDSDSFAYSLSDTNENLIANNLSNLLDNAALEDITSSNPYDYTNNKYFLQLVNLGPKALPAIRKMIRNSDQNGLKEYILAIAAEKIAGLDLKGDTFAWSNAYEWSAQWDKHLRKLPQTVANIFVSKLSNNEKNKALAKLGIPAIPFIVDEIARGQYQYNSALRTLIKGSTGMKIKDKESVASWITENEESIRFLRGLSGIYQDK